MSRGVTYHITAPTDAATKIDSSHSTARPSVKPITAEGTMVTAVHTNRAPMR
jgi:hypothetical protein